MLEDSGVSTQSIIRSPFCRAASITCWRRPVLVLWILLSPLADNGSILRDLARLVPSGRSLKAISAPSHNNSRIFAVGPPILGWRVNQGPHRQADSFPNYDCFAGAQHGQHLEQSLQIV